MAIYAGQRGDAAPMHQFRLHPDHRVLLVDRYASGDPAQIRLTAVFDSVL